MATSLLLADDSPTIAKILGMALQSEDYEIRSALTAEDALKELHARPPFFFLIDLTLPGKNGYEFARLIRADRKLKDVRILLLASAFEPADENEVKASGADGVITKPFDPGELRRSLREVANAPRSFGIAEATGSLSGSPIVPAAAIDQPPPAPPAASAPATDRPPAAPSPAALSIAPAEPEPDISALLLGQGEVDPLSILAGTGEPDANDILGSALASQPSPAANDGPPVFDISDSPEEFTNATVILEQAEIPAEEPAEGPPPVLDLSNSFATPPRGTAIIDLMKMSQEPPSAPKAPEAPEQASLGEKPLSANAQALAAFFAAEIDANAPTSSPAPSPASAAPSEPKEDAFDASLSSIEWGTPKANLNEWSSTPPPGAAKPATPSASFSPTAAPMAAPVTEAPPAWANESKRELTQDIPDLSSIDPAIFAAPDMAPSARQPQRQEPAPSSPRPQPIGASSEGGSFLFDTGGSNFRFADDYVQRITKAFTGNADEATPETETAPIFRKNSDDRSPSSSPSSSSSPAAPSAPTDPLAAKAKYIPTGGGAWSPEEVKRIEQIVRDEVQMVVREIAEKVVWEVVPELAENLIKKELEKVLKEME